jgi:hypothetical protein
MGKLGKLAYSIVFVQFIVQSVDLEDHVVVYL